MDEHELESRLRARLHARFDRAEVPVELRDRVAESMRAGVRPVHRDVGRAPFALAAVLVVAVALAVGGPLRSMIGPAISPTPTASASPAVLPSSSPAPSSSPTASPAPTAVLPSGSVPPVSASTWTGLSIQALPDGPAGVSDVVGWSGGYLALGHASDTTPLPAWLSRDGRSWVALPADTFGVASLVSAASWGGGLIVATTDATGTEAVRISHDGLSWSTAATPLLRVGRDGSITGNGTGLVACLDDPQVMVAFSADGFSWDPITIPGTNRWSCQAVAAFGQTFVIVGYVGGQDPSTPATPVAWWSTDGRHWTRATVQAQPEDGFVRLAGGSEGLVAISTQPGYTPGTAHFWTSTDGRTWKLSTADPLGILEAGEGVGGANGTFVGDGNRLLVYSNRGVDQPIEYWASLDGSHWTKLALSGDTNAALTRPAPFLLHDGVFFAGDQGSAVGQATP